MGENYCAPLSNYRLPQLLVPALPLTKALSDVWQADQSRTADTASWPTTYTRIYVEQQRRNRDQRWRKTVVRRQRLAQARHAPASEHALVVELARHRLATARAAVMRRQTEGFRHPGGALPSHPNYLREAFVYPGLVSDECAGLKHFVATLPCARRLHTGDYEGDACTGDRKIIALDALFIEDDPRMRGKLCIKIKRVFPGGFAELENSIAACGLPLPNHVVGHVDAAGKLHDPHLIWRIAEAVSCGEKSRQAPQTLFNLSLRGLTERLLPIGADPDALANALQMRNPLSPLWARCNLVVQPYTLQEDRRPGAPGFIALEPFLNLSNICASMRASAAMRRSRPCLSLEERRARLSKGGSNGGKVGPMARGDATLAAVAQAIRRFAATGCRPTQVAVAREIGRGERTVRRYWEAALILAAKPATKPLHDRKKASSLPSQSRRLLPSPKSPKSIGRQSRAPYGAPRRRPVDPRGPSGVASPDEHAFGDRKLDPPTAAAGGRARSRAGTTFVAPWFRRYRLDPWLHLVGCLQVLEGTDMDTIAAVTRHTALVLPSLPVAPVSRAYAPLADPCVRLLIG